MSRLYVPFDSQQKKVILLSSMNHAHEFNSKRVFFFAVACAAHLEDLGVCVQ
jgi:hypothetical protein